ncbi:MAG TPA: hypothetical protein VML54_07230 [Candidatus Limnocylindrales bacterium]|nr:hypothetical protein [Candidatus Limnocylindrales bacterium]
MTAVVLGAWLGLTGLLAAAGFFQDFTSLPPRFVLVIVPPLLAIVALARASAVIPLIEATPPAWLVGAQAFRIVVEIVLWALVVAGATPEIMTFTGTGRNFDVAVGITAPVMAALLGRGDRPGRRRLALWWNVAGILVLVNTVLHALLATPTRFQVFLTSPPNALVASFPYIWLPGFLVPVAWALHVLSIRQLVRAPRRSGRRGRAQ